MKVKLAHSLAFFVWFVGTTLCWVYSDFTPVQTESDSNIFFNLILPVLAILSSMGIAMRFIFQIIDEWS